jgi:hypothetical protein
MQFALGRFRFRRRHEFRPREISEDEFVCHRKTAAFGSMGQVMPT